MADLVESARAILSVSERRLEAAAQNVANLSTPGYKNQIVASEVTSDRGALVPGNGVSSKADLSAGKLARTGGSLDLALAGAGFFLVSGAAGLMLTRSGQFHLGDGGRVLGGRGMVLQAADGGDLVLPNAAVKILADGTVLDGDKPIARVALVEPEGELQAHGGSLFAMPGAGVREAATPNLQQGYLENSNVALAEQMVAMMEATRSAEGGARLVQAYDDLMGKAINSFSQGAR